MKSHLFTRIALLFLLPFLLNGCSAGLSNRPKVQIEHHIDTQDRSCAYFYYLWGNHSEYNRKYTEALDAYEKAGLCDPHSYRIREKLVLSYLKTGNEAKAAIHLQKLIQKEQSTLEQHLMLARLLVRLGKFKNAVELYKKVLEQDPDNETARLQLGLVYSIEKKYVLAEEIFLSVYRTSKESYQASLYLAKLYREMERIDNALDWYTKALLLNWSAKLMDEVIAISSHFDKFNKLLEIYNSVLQQNPTNDDVGLGLLHTLLVMEKEEEAISFQLEMKQRGRPTFQYDLLLGRYFIGNNKFERAKSFLNSSLKQKKTSEAYYLLGLISIKQNRNMEGLTFLQKITPKDEEYQKATQLQVILYTSMDRRDKALSMLKGRIKNKELAQPNDFLLLAELYQEQKKLEKARELLEQSIQQFPENEGILFELGLLFEKTGDRKQAISTMQRLITINSNHPQALNFVGYTWADGNIHLNKALDYIQRAAHLLPDNGYIQDSLGWVHFRLGNFDKAKEILQKAIQLAPDDPLIHDHLGDVYNRLGQKASAVQSYEKAFQLFSEDEKKQLMKKKINLLKGSLKN